jgi:putative phage-type endonuclease
MTYTILPEYEQDSPEWHEARQHSLGASEVAAVLGLSPFQTPLTVYMAKHGVVNEIPEDLAYFGHALEAPIAQWVRDKHPELGRINNGFTARSNEYPWLTATPDRTADDIGLLIPVEIKTSSAYSKDSWADGVPLYYAAQVQTQLLVLDAPYGWLAVLHGGNTPELHRVERDQEWIENYLIPRTREFWENHVLAHVPPEPTTSQEAVELWPGNLELTIEGDERLEELWGAYGLLQAEKINAEEALDAMKLQLQIAMQDATSLTYNGRTLFTWKPRAGARRFDDKALLEADPTTHARYMQQGAPTRTFIRTKADTK